MLQRGNSLTGGGESPRRDHDAGEVCLIAGMFRSAARLHEIILNLMAVKCVIVWKHVSLRHMQHLNAEDTGHLLLVDEIRIAELCEPGKVIEHRMIDAVRTG